MIAIDKYLESVSDSEDVVLMNEVKKCVRASAYRSAYIMIWISCAESLKRRFVCAGKFDSDAGKVVTDVNKLEEKHHSIDAKILDEAKAYGFITAIEYQKLKHIYEMRCVYGHPYQDAPSEEEVICAIAEVTESVLSKNIKFRNGYISRLVDNMINEECFLDDDEAKIIQYAKSEMSKIAPELYGYMLGKLWERIEENALEKLYEKIYDRVCIFSNYIIAHSDFQIYSDVEWHQIVMKYPHTMVGVLYNLSAYKIIGRLAQDTHISNMVKLLDYYPSVHKYFFAMYNFISSDNKIKYEKWLKNVEWEKIKSTKINLKAIYSRLINMFETHNYYQQNPATIYLDNNSNQIKELSNDQQVELGRNVLQAADGGANESHYFLKRINNVDDPEDVYGHLFVEGLLKECFINEKKEIRIKMKYLLLVYTIYNKLREEYRDEIFYRIMDEIKIGCLKNDCALKQYLDKDGTEEFEKINGIDRLVKIIEEIKTK